MRGVSSKTTVTAGSNYRLRSLWLFLAFRWSLLCSQHVSQCNADEGYETDKQKGIAHLNFSHTALSLCQCLETENHEGKFFLRSG